MIGVRAGLRVGVRCGVACGVSEDAIALTPGLAGVTRDATSGIYCPANTTEWATVLSAAGITSGGPSALHLMQDASGNPADAIGAFPLTASGTGITYAQPITGWSRLGITFNDGGTGAFTSTDAALPDISTTSLLVLGYLKTSVSAANRSVAGLGTTRVEAILQSTGAPRLLSGANSAVGTGNTVGQVRPWAIRHNKTASTDVLFTDQEKVTPTFSALTTGKQIQVGQGSTTHGPVQHAYIVWFFGAAAELTDAQLKTLLQTLGWTIAWT